MLTLTSLVLTLICLPVM